MTLTIPARTAQDVLDYIDMRIQYYSRFETLTDYQQIRQNTLNEIKRYAETGDIPRVVKLACEQEELR